MPAPCESDGPTRRRLEDLCSFGVEPNAEKNRCSQHVGGKQAERSTQIRTKLGLIQPQDTGEVPALNTRRSSSPGVCLLPQITRSRCRQCPGAGTIFPGGLGHAFLQPLHQIHDGNGRLGRVGLELQSFAFGFFFNKFHDSVPDASMVDSG